MKTLFVRGGYLNQFEAQNIEPIAERCGVVGIASMRPIHNKFSFPVEQFWSPYDVGKYFGGLFATGVKYISNRTIGDQQYLFGLEKYVMSTGPYDVAHVAETHYAYDLQIVNLKRKGYIKKIVSTCWETIAHNNETATAKKKLKNIVRQNIDIFICPTERAKRALIAEGVEPQKIEVIRIGVDLTKFKITDADLKRKANKEFTVLFVGRPVHEKGFNDLNKLKYSLRSHNPNRKITLTVVGQKPVVYSQIPNVYKKADVLIVPSHMTPTWEEQYAMVLVEAMAMGVPIVAYDTGAIAEVVGNAGLLVAEGNIAQMRLAIQSYIDDEYMHYKYRMMAKGRALHEFDAKKIAAEIEKIYLRV